VTHTITLKAMRFHALVGVLLNERERAQPIEVDLRVTINDGPEIVDYGALYDVTATVLGAGHIDYLEEIADRVATRTLALTPRIRTVAVAVRKPHVSLGGPLAFAEVVVERSAL
jgi:dihydroneopterin aldolase